MVITIFTAVISIIMLVLLAICFFDLGYIVKELVLYTIRTKTEEQAKLAKKIIDNQDKF